MVIANRVENNANPAMERPAVTQFHGIRTNKKQRCKLNFYVKLVDTLLMNSGYDEATQQQHPLYFPYSLITDM